MNAEDINISIPEAIRKNKAFKKLIRRQIDQAKKVSLLFQCNSALFLNANGYSQS